VGLLKGVGAELAHFVESVENLDDVPNIGPERAAALRDRIGEPLLTKC